MCTQKPPHDYSKELYERYKQSFSTYIAERVSSALHNSVVMITFKKKCFLVAYAIHNVWLQVLPSLKGGQGEFLLKELCKRWTNHKIMVRWLSRFFNYLDR